MKKNNFLNSFNADIHNIIFDLGGVIINVDYHKTENAFKSLGISDFEKVFSQVQQSKIVDKLETGNMSISEFRENLRKMCEFDISDTRIDDAWNAMILDFPDSRIDILNKLRLNYRIFLLSNTNRIHIDYCMKNPKFEVLISKFEKVYLSHEIHKRKPDVKTYEFVLTDSQLHASQTLFIDDTVANLEGAKLAGLNVYHLTSGETVNDLFG
jgi:putative hydrolase of the HAD superfamily